VPTGNQKRLSPATTMVIILAQLFALSIPMPLAKDKPKKLRRKNIPTLWPKIEPVFADPFPTPRASGKENAAIATMPIRYNKALKNAQIATKSNESGLSIVCKSFRLIA